jgi:UDP-N-acetylglucosamine acyltransferase
MALIHPSAVVALQAELAPDVEIGPFAVIGPYVRIGAGTRVMAHAVIDGHTTIGDHCEIFPMASLGQKTQDLKFTGGICYLHIGNHNVFREFVTVNTATNDGDATAIGDHNLIMAYCHIAHKCVIGNHVIMSNLATLAGDVTIEDHAVLGGMAGVHQFCRIGQMAMVGACTKIVQDIVPFCIADGNPAASVGLNLVKLKRMGMDEPTIAGVKEAYRLIFRQQLKAREAVARIRAELAACPPALNMADFIDHSDRGIVR